MGVVSGFVGVTKGIVYAATTCLFALGGATVGLVYGAIKGHTTETGFVNGAGIGAVAGAVVAVQLLESAINGESVSKVSLLASLLNGKVFMEWVSPEILKAYQWQIGSLESANGSEITDIYDEADKVKGLSKKCIEKLPVYEFRLNRMREEGPLDTSCCSICLEDYKDGHIVKRLPRCGHFFHLECIDQWFYQLHESCPFCRTCVYL